MLVRCTGVLFLLVVLVSVGFVADARGVLNLEVSGVAKKLSMEEELQRTGPDYVVYVPGSSDGATFDTGNEHFLVFDGPDGNLMAVWTQSTKEGLGDQRMMFSKSSDEGISWDKPRVIAGPRPGQQGNMASWGFPLVSKSGRIYVLFNRHTGVNDIFTHTTGFMGGVYSDDAGKTWSEAGLVPMLKTRLDNSDPKIGANWIVWQKPERLSNGKYFAGFTRWVAKDVRHEPANEYWVSAESVVEFMRFENIDDDPAIKDIEISNFEKEDDAVRVSYPGHPELSVVQEPSTVMLPGGGLFCVMRTMTGNPYYITSQNRGEKWSEPKPLLNKDGGKAFLHPLSPCPIYRYDEGKYVFFFHNNDGHFGKWGPFDTTWHRRPIYMCLGEYREGSEQPIWFSKPKLLMDNDGVAIGYKEGRADMAMYASFTNRNGRRVLWYPDRKFFLVGKNITDEMLADMTVPRNK